MDDDLRGSLAGAGLDDVGAKGTVEVHEPGLDIAANGEPREKVRILEDEAALGLRW